MPRVLRENLPRPLMRHLLDRIQEREITEEQLGYFSNWLKTEPEVPPGLWYKRFPGMIVCGEGELVKTFLRIGQAPTGEEVF